MHVVRLSSEEYKKKPVNVQLQYNLMEFCEFNRWKVSDIHYLLFQDEKKERFVIPFGEENGCLTAPFSAPFCLPGEICKITSAEHYIQAIQALEEYAKSIRMKRIRITFPPFLYGERQVSYWLSAAFLSGWELKELDLNYALDLKHIKNTGYENIIAYNAKKNLRIAHEKKNQLHFCCSGEECEKAYDIIRINRESKGYPLRMTFEQVEWTRAYVKGEWFSVISGTNWTAAAVVFPVTENVAQVIYWGDMPGNDSKAVNFLAEQLSIYYADKGYNYLDIGPSTDHSEPNYGLISFKESIGCGIQSKLSVEKIIERE